ncbi:MAG: energy transducer TonB [Bacteroidota bacterium]
MILDKIRYAFMARVRREEGLPPKVKRDEKVVLGAPAKVVFEASLVAALSIMICAFMFFPEIQPATKISKVEQEMVKFEDIENTRQENRPPPPPRPPIPIEAPGDETLEDIEIGSTEIDIAEEIAPPPPRDDSDDEAYFVAVEDMPQVIGGIESIMRKLVYPELAMRAGVQGRVYVLAFVNEKGEVVKAEVQKGIGAGCDEAAVAAVMQSKFIPGKQRGKAVKVRVSIPIRFQITG